MKQQTALTELIEKAKNRLKAAYELGYEENHEGVIQLLIFLKEAESLLPKEKQQIIEAYYQGGTNEPNSVEQCQQYFSETYEETK